ATHEPVDARATRGGCRDGTQLARAGVPLSRNKCVVAEISTNLARKDGRYLCGHFREGNPYETESTPFFARAGRRSGRGTVLGLRGRARREGRRKRSQR